MLIQSEYVSQHYLVQFKNPLSNPEEYCQCHTSKVNVYGEHDQIKAFN